VGVRALGSDRRALAVPQAAKAEDMFTNDFIAR